MASRMKRKFSFDIPKLKMGSSRPESRAWREHYASPPVSRPSTPKSVRPPLPNDVDAELRAACTYVIRHPKPSHELWDAAATKPALDYAAIKMGATEPLPSVPARMPSTRAKVDAIKHDIPANSSKFSYKPNVATEDLFKQEEGEQQLLNPLARSRVDQLMAPEPPRHTTFSSRTRSTSHSHSNSQQQLPSALRVEAPRMSTRSDSVCTSGSTPHTDSTDYPWSASTALTSAVVTPARSSKRTSSQNVGSEIGSAPKVDPVNSDWMRLELERHKRVVEEREREKERGKEGRAVQTAIDATPAQLTTQSPTLSSQVPRRKPVPTSRPESRQVRDVSRPATRQEARQDRKDSTDPVTDLTRRERADSGRAEGVQQTTDPEPRGRVPVRSSSRLGRVSRAASRVAKRAASKAESITNDVLDHYMLPGSEPFDNYQSPTSPVGSQFSRPERRMRNVSTHVKDYFRSASRTGSRKPSVDISRNHTRSQSVASYHSANSGVAASERSSRWRKWRPGNKNNVNAAAPDSRRSDSALSGEKGRGESGEELPSPPQRPKPPMNLNRELPPLPSLDQWKPVEPAVESPKPASSVAAVIAPANQGVRRALSRQGRDRLSPSSHSTSKEDVVSSRMGASTPPRSRKQSADIKSISGGHPLPNPPLHLSLGYDQNMMNFSQLSLSQSVEPPSNTGGSHRQLRSNSNLSPRPDAGREVPSQSQTSADNPVHVMGNPNLLHQNYQSGSGTSRTTPSGHSRESSNAGPKYSSDDYHHLYDARFQHTVEIPSQTKKSKKKWWQPVKEKRSAHWMEQVMQSGAKNGMLVPDEVAGAPIVRY